MSFNQLFRHNKKSLKLKM